MQKFFHPRGTHPRGGFSRASEFGWPKPLRMKKLRAAGESRFPQSGFTLTELMITLAIAVVLTVIAIPSFKSIIYSNKLTATANDMVAALNSARLEAVKRNATTQFCSNSATVNTTTDNLGTACGVQTGAVYVWPAASASTAAILVLAPTSGIVFPMQVSGNVAALRFNGQGLAQGVGSSTLLYAGTVATICTTSISSNNRRVITMTAGSILTTTSPSSPTTCP